MEMIFVISVSAAIVLFFAYDIGTALRLVLRQARRPHVSVPTPPTPPITDPNALHRMPFPAATSLSGYHSIDASDYVPQDPPANVLPPAVQAELPPIRQPRLIRINRRDPCD